MKLERLRKFTADDKSFYELVLLSSVQIQADLFFIESATTIQELHTALHRSRTTLDLLECEGSTRLINGMENSISENPNCTLEDIQTPLTELQKAYKAHILEINNFLSDIDIDSHK